ncbi:MAG: DUF3024 domain-containing protein [Acidimicrobiales bacterium]|nr:DUF3024 domain-containing protein [Acidimicrobiales bacterium]
MPIPSADLDEIQRWIETKNGGSGDRCDDIRLEADVGARAVTILESRPRGDDSADSEPDRRRIARLRFTASRNEWRLYRTDHRGRFTVHKEAAPTPLIGPLLVEIDDDPTGVFWD